VLSVDSLAFLVLVVPSHGVNCLGVTHLFRPRPTEEEVLLVAVASSPSPFPKYARYAGGATKRESLRGGLRDETVYGTNCTIIFYF